jgi:hypothetical protein
VSSKSSLVFAMLQGKPGSAGARAPKKPTSNSSTPSLQPPSKQKQQQAQQRKQKAAAPAVRQGRVVEHKRPAQLQSPPKPKRQSRLPIREAISPVRPDPPSKDVIFSNLLSLAEDNKGPLQFQGQIKYVFMTSAYPSRSYLSQQL